MPISLDITLLFASFIRKKRIPQVSKVAKIAPKVKRETFKKRTLTGTKKNIITIRQGTKNGYINIL